MTSILVVVAGSALVTIDGGGVKPMQQRREKALGRWDEERRRTSREAQGAQDRIAGRAQELKGKAREPGDGSSSGAGASQWQATC